MAATGRCQCRPVVRDVRRGSPRYRRAACSTSSRPTSPWLFIAMVRRRMSICAPSMLVLKDAQRQRPSTMDQCCSSLVRPSLPEEGGILAAMAAGLWSLTIVTVALVVAAAWSRPADIMCYRPHCRQLCYAFSPIRSTTLFRKRGVPAHNVVTSQVVIT